MFLWFQLLCTLFFAETPQALHCCAGDGTSAIRSLCLHTHKSVVSLDVLRLLAVCHIVSLSKPRFLLNAAWLLFYLQLKGPDLHNKQRTASHLVSSVLFPLPFMTHCQKKNRFQIFNLHLTLMCLYVLYLTCVTYIVTCIEKCCTNTCSWLDMVLGNGFNIMSFTVSNYFLCRAVTVLSSF